MNLEEAVRELRATKLPLPRQRQLVIEAVHSPSDAARSLLVARARYEAREGDRRHQEAVEANYAARWALAQERTAYEPRPVERKPLVDDRSMDGPVRISWTTPRRPELVRPPRRAEIVGANRKPRTKTVPEEKVPEVVEVVEPAKPKKILYADQPPLELPEGKKHGQQSYRDFKCRCAVCREGKRLNRKGQGIKAPKGSIPEHGTTTGYTKLKCRDDCPGNSSTGRTCRQAVTEYARERRVRKALEAKK